MATKGTVEARGERLVSLKRAYEAGYYQTEAAVDAQSPFPWQSKTCADCPYWTNSICRVHAAYRSAGAHTCVYFDEPNREAAEDIIRERQWQGYRRWWEWFNRS